MSSSSFPATASVPHRTRPHRRQGALRAAFHSAVRTTRGRVGLALTSVVLVVSFVGPLAPGKSPTEFAGAPFSRGAGAGLLGTDVLGRNVTARVLDGGWQILLMAIVATALACAVGATLGVFAAYLEGWVDQVVMRAVDVVLAIPQLVLALLLISVSSTSKTLLVLAVAVAQAPQVARVVHGSAQNICERDFVKAVALWGVRPPRVVFGQVIPNLVTPLCVEVGLRLSFSIVLIAGLNFLGFGVTPPDPNWGSMVNENRLGLGVSSYGVLAPAVLLALLAVGTNMFADAIARANLGTRQADALEVRTALNGERGEHS